MDRVEVRGLQIAYRRAGHGPPLVLVHGAPGDSRVWRRQLDDLADSFEVIAWDAPGCGESEDAPESFRLPDYADALAGLIAAVGLGRPHVLGHSFGGALVLELYRRHPSLPATLILTGAYGVGRVTSTGRGRPAAELRARRGRPAPRRLRAGIDARPVHRGDVARHGW